MKFYSLAIKMRIGLLSLLILLAHLLFMPPERAMAFARQKETAQAVAPDPRPVELSFEASLAPQERVLVIQGTGVRPQALLQMVVNGKNFWLIQDATRALPDQTARWYLDRKLKALVIIWSDSTMTSSAPQTVRLLVAPEGAAAQRTFQVTALTSPPQTVTTLTQVPREKSWQVVAK